MQHALKIIYEQLPVYAETGTDTQTLDIARLEQIICDQTQGSKETATTVIHLVERLFVSCALLHEELLNNTPKQWQFVSCPAFLFAKSLLQTWIDPDHTWFEPDFWKNDTFKMDSKKNLIGQFFSQKTYNVLNSNETDFYPTRFIHTAWAFIKMDSQIVFSQRSDKHWLDTLNYFLVGDQLQSYDFKSSNKNEGAIKIHQPNNESIQTALKHAIARIMKQQAGLLYKEDYEYEILPIEIPSYHYKQDNSTDNYWVYDFKCFGISLTTQGFFKVYEKIIPYTENNILYNYDHVIENLPYSGETGCIKTLYNYFVNHEKTIKQCFSKVPSIINTYHFKNDNFIFPIEENDFLKYGKNGNEIEIPHNLSTEEIQLLVFLAVHGKQLTIETHDNAINLISHGWIKVNNYDLKIKIKSVSHKLAKIFDDCESPIEWYGDTQQYVRLSIHPDYIYFSWKLFNVTLSDNEPGTYEFKLKVNRKEISLPIGISLEKTIQIGINHDTFNLLQKINQGEKIYAVEHDALKRWLTRIGKKHLRSIGLRNFLHVSDGIFQNPWA